MSVWSDLVKGGVEGILSPIANIISKFKADPTVVANNAKEIAALELAFTQAQLQAEVLLSQAQNKVNEIQAASSDKYVARARPTIMWICAIGLAYEFIAWPFLVWGSLNFKWMLPPTLDMGTLIALLSGMLGLSVTRTYEKSKGLTK